MRPAGPAREQKLKLASQITSPGHPVGTGAPNFSTGSPGGPCAPLSPVPPPLPPPPPDRSGQGFQNRNCKRVGAGRSLPSRTLGLPTRSPDFRRGAHATRRRGARAPVSGRAAPRGCPYRETLTSLRAAGGRSVPSAQARAWARQDGAGRWAGLSMGVSVVATPPPTGCPPRRIAAGRW